MEKILLFLFFSNLNSIYSENEMNQGYSRRIQGGIAIAEDDPLVPSFLAQIVVQKDGAEHFSPNKRRCAGSVLNRHFILTAAQCFQPIFVEGTQTSCKIEPEDVILRLGSIKLDQGKQYEVKEIHIHPKYEEKHKHYDMALLETKIEIDYNISIARVKFISLNKDAKIVYPKDKPMTVYGWGVTHYGNNHSISLYAKVLNVTYLDEVTCLEIGHGRIQPKIELCATSAQNTGSCYGDGGAPLVLNFKLIGILSRPYTNTEGCLYQPKVYTKITADLNWLESFVHKQN